MKTAFRIFLFTLLFIHFHKVDAQISQTELETSVNAGIDPYFIESTDTVSKFGPRCITRDILQDKNGRLWLATWHGIIMYDGKVFTNYTLKNGLIHFHVLSCYEDRKSNLWFGTARGGMYRYDGKVFKLFTKKDGLPDNTITCFEEDKEGNMWFGTENGLSRYDGKSFKNYSTANGLRSNNISSIIIDTSGKIWVGCLSTKYMADDGGLCYCIINSDDSSQITETGNAKLFTGFLNRDGRPFKTVTDLFQDKQGKIWIGRFDGLSCYDGRSLTELFPAYLSYYIIDDKQGNIWLTHSELNKEFKNTPRQVLYKYNGNAFTMIMDKYEPDDFQIFGKAVDMEGNIWFGTMKGPCRYDGKNFTYFYENQE